MNYDELEKSFPGPKDTPIAVAKHVLRDHLTCALWDHVKGSEELLALIYASYCSGRSDGGRLLVRLTEEFTKTLDSLKALDNIRKENMI